MKSMVLYSRGLTKLRDGRFVIIYGSQWEGERSYGVVATDLLSLV